MKTITTNSQDAVYKAENQIVSLDSTFQKTPDLANERQHRLEKNVEELRSINRSMIARMTMSRGDKQLLAIDAKANQEALQIMKSGQNDNLRAITDYQTRYVKTMLHNLVLVGEANLVGASKTHYENAKALLHDNLLGKLDEMTTILENIENRAAGKPEKFRQAILKASDSVLERWTKDFERHLDEFASLLEKTFK
jgi:hypothetical protein